MCFQRAVDNSLARLARFTFFALCVWEFDGDLALNKEISKILPLHYCKHSTVPSWLWLEGHFHCFVVNDLFLALENPFLYMKQGKTLFCFLPVTSSRPVTASNPLFDSACPISLPPPS